MFGFHRLEAEELGSAGRYHARVERFETDGMRAPRARHRAWWVVHNCIAHMVLGIAPCQTTFRFHDWTSRRLNHDEAA